MYPYAVPLHVLHLVSSNARRGAETFGYELHRALEERGVRSAIRCIVHGVTPPLLPVRPLGSSRLSLAGIRELRRCARMAGIVVAHGSSTLLACGAGLIGTGVPFVYLSIGDPRYWAGSRSRRVRVRWLLRRAAAVVAISPSARDVLVDHYGLDHERVRVIPNGRNADRFKPVDAAGRRAARSALGLPDDADIAAVVGALSSEKRVDLAIRAVAQLPGVRLVVAGDGPERQRLTEVANRLAPGRVVFLGATDESVGVLSAADVLVLSSDSEGVPGVLIEAGLAGLPVVATDVGWVSDVVRHGATGLLVEPGSSERLAEGLRKALDQREALGRSARTRCVAEFDMSAVTDRWQHLIAEVGRRFDTF